MATFHEISAAMNLLYRVDDESKDEVVEEVDFLINNDGYKMFCEGHH